MSHHHRDPHATTRRWGSWWIFAVIVMAALASYHNSLYVPLGFDDAPSRIAVEGRPALNLSLAIHHGIGETAIATHHVVNLFLHTCAGLVIFGLIRRTLRLSGPGPCGGNPRGPLEGYGNPGASGRPADATWIALAVAVLWTVHPLQTESVTYIIQPAEPLAGLFYLLTLYSFVRAAAQQPDARSQSSEVREENLASVGSQGQGDRTPFAPPTPRAGAKSARRVTTGWLALSVLACLLGMGTKEVVATAPLMVLLFDRTFVAGTFLAAWRQRRGYYLALGGTWLLLGWLTAQTGGAREGLAGFSVGVGVWDYWLTQFKAVGHYLRLSLWPHPLVFEYGSFWIREFSEIAVHVALVFGLIAATIMELRRRSAAGFLGAWFLGTLAPTSLVPGAAQIIVEHRMYLPLAAVIALAVGAGHTWFTPRRRTSFGALIGGIAVALVLLTVRRNEDYDTDVALWTDTVAKRPNNPLAHFKLARAHERAGNLGAALTGYEQTLELKPDFSVAYARLGELLLQQGRHADAIARFEAALRLQPAYAEAHASLGSAFLAEGQITEAVGHLEKAAQLTPESPTVRRDFGNALAAAGLAGEAVLEFEAALKLQPDMPEAHFNLANALFELGRLAESARHYETTLHLAPAYPGARENLLRVRSQMGEK